MPDHVAIAYGRGFSAKFYRTGGILYAPLINTNGDGLLDHWRGVQGTNSSGSNAAHPGVFYPGGGQ